MALVYTHALPSVSSGNSIFEATKKLLRIVVCGCSIVAKCVRASMQSNENFRLYCGNSAANFRSQIVIFLKYVPILLYLRYEYFCEEKKRRLFRDEESRLHYRDERLEMFSDLV